MKPVFYSPNANQDVAAAILYYEEEAGAVVASGFVDALEEIIDRIATWPASGSPYFGELLSLPGLRSWKIQRFPYIVFTMERPDRVNVWRVLHERRDIPSTLQSSLEEYLDW